MKKSLEIRRLIDIVHTNRPFLGSRRITDALQGVNYRINRKRVQRLMEEMDIQAIYPKPNTSKPNAKHKVYPYLLRNLNINKPNQVFATDITYIPMPKGIRISDRNYGLVFTERFYPGGCQTVWIPPSVLTPLKRP